MTIAQTNVELYNQLLSLGWVDEDLRQVRSAYRLAMQLVAGHFCANERPYLAHLVGVASLLARDAAPPTVVSAGMLHSVYAHGEFGDGSHGIREDKRRRVRQAVGAACEELVARYAAWPWERAAVERLLARTAGCAPTEAAVAWIRLADVVENHNNRGMLYCPEKAEVDTAIHMPSLELAGLLARKLGLDPLADHLAAVNTAGDCVPDCLASTAASSFTLAPMSHGMRTTVRLGHLYRLLRDSFSSPAVQHLANEAA